MPKIKMTFTLLAVVSLMAGVLTGVALIKSRSASGDEAVAYETRYHSYLLADELRQSSDDLTRLGRTYVATADAFYKTPSIWTSWQFGTAKNPVLRPTIA